MSKRTTKAWRTAACGTMCVVFISLVCTVCGQGVFAADKGGESPDALFKRLQIAAKTSNYNEISQCIAPDDLSMMNLSLIIAGQMLVAFAQMGVDISQQAGEDAVGEDLPKEEKEKAAAELKKASEEAEKMGTALAGVLEKHGLTKKLEKSPTENLKDEAEMKKAAKELLKDADQAALLTDLMGFMQQNMDEGESEPLVAPDCELKDLNIDGDKATAKCGDEDLLFIKIDNRWFLSMPEEVPEP